MSMHGIFRGLHMHVAFYAISSVALAQGHAVNLDSLLGIWNDHSKSDSIRLTAIHDICWEAYLESDTDSALRYAQLGHAFSLRTGKKKFEADGLNTLAIVFKVRHDYETAIAHGKRALAISGEINYREGICTALYTLGITCIASGRNMEALSHLERSISTCQQLGDSARTANSLYALGQALAVTGQGEVAALRFDECIRIRVRLGDKRGTAACYNMLGNIQYDRGDLDSALGYFSRSLRLKEQAGDERGIANSLLNIGMIYDEQGDVATARNSYVQSLALFEGLGNKRGMVTAIFNIAIIDSDAGDNEGSLRRLQTALDMTEQEGDLSMEARVVALMGSILADLGQTTAAKSRLRQAKAIFEDIGDSQGVAQTVLNLASLAVEAGNNQDAIADANRAYDIAIDVEDIYIARDASELLVKANKGLGRFADAYTSKLRYIGLRDSISSMENQRAVLKHELESGFAKKQLIDSLSRASETSEMESEKTIAHLRANRERTTSLAIAGTSMLLLIGGGVAFTLDRKRRKARHARKAAHLQTQAWRAQVNPHFIHTALQNINEYVQANERDLASSFLTRFARLMRAVLENARKDEVSLQSDLDVLHDYLELEKARMHNGFTYSIDIDTDLDPEEAMVPPMLLQPFAEEAIWKGLAKKQGAGHISITVR